MNLDESQKQKISEWIEQGLKLSDIQNKIATDFGQRLTYMEVRFLIDDLGVKLKDKEVPPPAPPPAAAAPQPADGTLPKTTPAPDLSPDNFQMGKVSVVVDQVTRPGALVSGKVTFSDGKMADWYLDQMGRLGLAPREKDYKPSQDDIMEFQTELQNELQRQGF